MFDRIVFPVQPFALHPLSRSIAIICLIYLIRLIYLIYLIRVITMSQPQCH